MFVLREQDKHFLWSLWAGIGVIFVWKGLWEGLYEIPYLGNEWVALFVGLAILTFSGMIFREFDPLGSLEGSINKVMKTVKTHSKDGTFIVKYYDKFQKKEIKLPARYISKLDKGTLIIEDKRNKEEIFIPTHRVTEVLRNGKTYWKM